MERDDWDSIWTRYAASAEQNPAQLLRRELVFSRLLLDQAGAGARILDVGSGQGDFALELHQRFPQAEILGLELSQAGVELARRKVASARFTQRDLLADATPAADERRWATHAVCTEVLEHVDDAGLFLSNVAGYLAPGCRLIVTVPGGPMSAFDKHIGHRRHFTAALLTQVLTSAGFSVEDATGAGFPFFNLYRLAVVLRGQKLIDDVQGKSSGLARATMTAFRVLFSLNSRAAPWGWQIVATATAAGKRRS